MLKEYSRRNECTKKSTAPGRRPVGTDISIAKGFDNQKGPVTARGIRSFRHANLHGGGGDGGATAVYVCASCRQIAVDGDLMEIVGERREK